MNYYLSSQTDKEKVSLDHTWPLLKQYVLQSKDLKETKFVHKCSIFYWTSKYNLREKNPNKQIRCRAFFRQLVCTMLACVFYLYQSNERHHLPPQNVTVFSLITVELAKMMLYSDSVASFYFLRRKKKTKNIFGYPCLFKEFHRLLVIQWDI